MRDPRFNEFLEALWIMDIERVSRMLAEDQALLTIRSGIGETPLHYLAVENHLEAVKLLYEKGASIDAKNEFGTPVVFEVAQLGYKELLLWFLERGVDLTAVDENGNDIFGYLVEFEKGEILDFLRSHLNATTSQVD